jgi:hypothetical protein
MEYRARDDLFIELPQIFNAATAARDHDEIDRRKTSLGVASSRMATAISCAAPVPCTRTGLIRICNHGARRRSTFKMSRTAAPLGEVTIPIRAETSATAVSVPEQITFCLKFAL